MRLKASLLVTASGMTLVLLVVGLLHSTSHQATNAEPNMDALSLVTPLLQPPFTPSQPPSTSTAELVNEFPDRAAQPSNSPNETLSHPFSVNKSLALVEQLDHVLAHTRATPTQAQAAKQPVAEIDRTNVATQLRTHRWVGAVAGTLKQQDYEIKKLELALAQKQFKDGEIPKTTLAQKQASYQKVAREFKTFLNSSRMAN